MISDIITKLDPMGSNETSLLLVMTIIMFRKSVKLNVISMRSCVASLLSLVSIKPFTTTTTTNFESKQSD